jgi:hypothetical protein
MAYSDIYGKKIHDVTEFCEILDELVYRLKRLEKSRIRIIEETLDLVAEIEWEAEELEKGLSALKEQIMEFEVILSILHNRKKITG